MELYCCSYYNLFPPPSPHSDIDECASNVTNDCSQNCHNLDCLGGRYRCSCNMGYELGSDQHTCIGKNKTLFDQDIIPFSLLLLFSLLLIDTNECSLGTDNCQQLCINNVGSYSCDCNSGCELNSNGINCTGICAAYL